MVQINPDGWMYGLMDGCMHAHTPKYRCDNYVSLMAIGLVKKLTHTQTDIRWIPDLDISSLAYGLWS